MNTYAIQWEGGIVVVQATSESAAILKLQEELDQWNFS